ncbi:MAG TPA: AMP-binding protein [Stellaceae bacterium]|nr:AMP-binding protein [Stellaceae bacterium]
MPPPTPHYVRFHGLHRPTAIALVKDGREVTYRKFDSDLRKVTHALRPILPAPPGAVAVETDELYLHWLLLLACENLGVAAGSFQAEGIWAYQSLINSVDLVVAEHDVPAEWARKIHKLTPAWVAEALSQSELDLPEEIPAADMTLADTRRLVRSSGTTGPGKTMAVSRAAEEAIVRDYILHMGFSRESKFLITGGFNVGSMFWRATACLRVGATCVVEFRMSTARAIITHKPSHVRLFQHQVKSILDELPSTDEKPAGLTIMMGAGPLSEDMRRQIMARLATELVYTYNSNETYMIAVVDADGVATVRPGADVEVIDDQGRALPQGQVGRLKIRTDSLVDGYVGDPEATAQVFRDGWFYSNDVGMLVGHRRLKLLGRADDILNIGGAKIVPSVIEDMVVECAPVQEAGVTSIPGQEGIDEICIAIVPARAEAMPQITQAITAQVWPLRLGRAHIMAVDTLPRTETGKLQRHLLKAAFQQRLGR